MSGIWGNNIKISIFGESHGIAIGINMTDIPPGIDIDEEEIKKDMLRRAPGRSSLNTARVEADQVEIVSGVFNGKTTGAPLCGIIKNTNTRSKDYSKLKDVMRPGHSDYPASIKYNGFNDYRGGGHFSGRITAPLVFAGAIAKAALAKKGIFVGAHIKSIKDIKDSSFDYVNISKELLANLSNKEMAVIDENVAQTMIDEVHKAKEIGDSLGGTIECAIIGVDAGLGDPFFDSVESSIAHLAFSVPGVKGIEFGSGFDMCRMSGFEANDSYYYDEDGNIKTKTNNNGGILGGLTNGMPIVFNVGIKPTSSISREQQTIDINKKENTTLQVVGRHDPCITNRAVVVIEAIAALAIFDVMRGQL